MNNCNHEWFYFCDDIYRCKHCNILMSHVVADDGFWEEMIMERKKVDHE